MRAVKVEVNNDSDELLACRICLATHTKLYNIHDSELTASFLELLGTTVSVMDGFPQHVCGCCGRLLQKARELRQRCLRSDFLMKQVLMHQHSITTSFIQSIDRITNQLALRLATQTNTEIIECEHDPQLKNELEIQSEEIKLEENDELQVEFNEFNDIGDKDHVEELENIEVKPARAKRKRKGTTNETEERSNDKQPERKRRKTKKIKKMFESEEDFPKFESKYNMEIVVLSPEQQAENMAARKNSSNYLNSPFRCEFCYKGFSSDATFQNHNEKHHDPSVGKEQCELCRCRFRIPAFLRTHAETHRLKFVCRECRFVASNRYHAITHSREHSGFKYVCKYCGASFKKPSTHGTHVRVQHPAENAACDECGESFQGAAGLRMHKTRAHRRSADAEPEPTACGACGAAFASARAVERHAAGGRACDPRLRPCAACGENLASEQQLREHERQQHEQPAARCDQCNKTFRSAASLGVHVQRAHLRVKGARRRPAALARRALGPHVMCELCGKRCKNSTILKYHQRTHTGEKPHGCPRCPKRFVSPMLLHCHLRSHTGERPYKCTQCHKCFTQKSALTVHKTVHTGEKPFACPICGKTFTQSASVHTHVKYVHMKMPAPPRRRNHKRD